MSCRITISESGPTIAQATTEFKTRQVFQKYLFYL